MQKLALFLIEHIYIYIYYIYYKGNNTHPSLNPTIAENHSHHFPSRHTPYYLHKHSVLLSTILVQLHAYTLSIYHTMPLDRIVCLSKSINVQSTSFPFARFHKPALRQTLGQSILYPAKPTLHLPYCTFGSGPNFFNQHLPYRLHTTLNKLIPLGLLHSHLTPLTLQVFKKMLFTRQCFLVSKKYIVTR